MILFKAILKKYASQAEKTGWTFIEVPPKVSEQIKPGYKRSFRVKGKIDDFPLKNVALVPMGGGTFILPVKESIRKEIKKFKGDTVQLTLEEDNDGLILNKDLKACLKEDPDAQKYFMQLPLGHKNYFNNWINAAKTPQTIAKRIALTLNAMNHKIDFGEMLRNQKKLTEI